MHSCVVPECEIMVPTEILMCGHHWRRLPQMIRRRVNAAWRRINRSSAPTREAVEEYQASRREAISHFEEAVPDDAGRPA